MKFGTQRAILIALTTVGWGGDTLTSFPARSTSLSLKTKAGTKTLKIEMSRDILTLVIK